MNKGWYALIAFLSTGLLIAAFLIGFSFGIVRPNQYVLVKNRLNQELRYDASMQSPGPYFIGVASVLIAFPSNNILVDFSNSLNDNSTENTSQLANLTYVNRTLTCWTQDGLDFLLDVNFYYTLNQTNLLWFYSEFGDDWENLVAQLARKALKETAVIYPSDFYYSNRSLLQSQFQAALQKSYNTETNFSVKVSYFQIQYIQFTQSFEDSIVAKLVQQHYYNLYNYQGQIDLINANTTVFSNNTYNKINLTLSNATAVGKQMNLNQKSQALVSYLRNMTTAYVAIKNVLGVSWKQMYPLMYAIELKTGHYLHKQMIVVPKTVQRVIQSM